jgi:anti-sigma regulatory factor (Ser/Thr protein kinase)
MGKTYPPQGLRRQCLDDGGDNPERVWQLNRSDRLAKANWAFHRGSPANKIIVVYESEIEFAGAPSSVGEARRFVCAVLDAGGAGDENWTAAQVVSELATNAVLHARTEFAVSIAYDDTQIRVAVTDGRPLAHAKIRRFSNEATTGRGLRLIQTLGQSWGVDQTDSTKTVWCEIRRGLPADHEAEARSDEMLSMRYPADAEPARVGGVKNSRRRQVA